MRILRKHLPFRLQELYERARTVRTFATEYANFEHKHKYAPL